jgi:hypothetical protein
MSFVPPSFSFLPSFLPDCSAEAARAHVFQALRKIRATLNGQAAFQTRSVR